MEGELTTYVCLSGCRSVFVYMLSMYVLRESYQLLLLSFSSAHVSVDPTVVVRVMLDWSQCCSQHNQNCEFCVFMFFACSIACTLRSGQVFIEAVVSMWWWWFVCVVCVCGVCACVLSKCLRVYIQNVSVCAVKTPVSNVNTGVLPTHGGALNVHTWVFFSARTKRETTMRGTKRAHTARDNHNNTTSTPHHHHHPPPHPPHHHHTTPHTNTHKDTKTQRHKDTNTQTHKHTNTPTHTNTHKHTQTHTNTPRHETHKHTNTPTHTNTHKHHTPTPKPTLFLRAFWVRA